MKVICIAKQTDLDFANIKLTNGKIYDVISIKKIRTPMKNDSLGLLPNFGYFSHYRIIDDSGVKSSHWHSQFITLENWRDTQVNQVLEDL